VFDRATLKNPPRWAWPLADVLTIAGLIFFAFYFLTAFRFDVLFVARERQVDFWQWYNFPPIIARSLQYPSVALNDSTIPFPYLPSAVAMFLPLSALPLMVAFGFWIVLQAAAFAVVLWTGIKLSGAAEHRGRLLIALAAVLMAENQLGWDFRTHNNNVIYLALIMLGMTVRAAWLSGLLLAVSANLKIYSGILLFGLIWRREYWLAVSMSIAGVLIAVVLPIAVFGAHGYIQLLEGWVGQALSNAPPGKPALLPPDLLRKSAAFLLGADPASAAVSILVRTSQIVWLALVIGYFVFAKRPSGAASDTQARLSDFCVVLLAPLPFSIWFMPYHAIVLLPAYMLLLTVAVSTDRDIWTRRIAAFALIACQILRYVVTLWDLRGAVYLTSFVLILLALGALRRTEK
jgi:hypothetical protein